MSGRVIVPVIVTVAIAVLIYAPLDGPGRKTFESFALMLAASALVFALIGSLGFLWAWGLS